MATQRIYDRLFAGQPDEEPDTQAFAAIVDEAIYKAVLAEQPSFVAAVANLLKMGQTPAQIERRMVAEFGRNQATRDVRHVAEHLARRSA